MSYGGRCFTFARYNTVKFNTPQQAVQLPFETEWRERIDTPWAVEIDVDETMRYFSDEVAQTVHMVNSFHDRLSTPIAVIDERPDVVYIEPLHELPIFTKGFYPVSIPNTPFRFRMPVGLEVRVKNVLVKTEKSRFAGIGRAGHQKAMQRSKIHAADAA